MEKFNINGYRELNLDELFFDNSQILLNSSPENIMNFDKEILKYSFYEILINNEELLSSIGLRPSFIRAGYFKPQDLFQVTDNPQVDFFLLLKNNIGLCFGLHQVQKDDFCSLIVTEDLLLAQDFPQEIKILLQKKKLKSKEKKVLNAYLEENKDWILNFILYGLSYKSINDFQLNFLFIYNKELKGVYLVSVKDFKDWLMTLKGIPFSFFRNKENLFEFHLPLPLKMLDKKYKKEFKLRQTTVKD